MGIVAHVYSNGKAMENQPVTFDEAMFLVEHQNTLAEEPENFLGFTAPDHDDAVLQFIREEEDKWIVDIPVMNGDDYTGSWMSIADHSKTVAMITNFFIEESNLRQGIVNQDYELVEKELGKRWGLGIHFVEPREE